jgi:hypothetical protein
VAGRFRTIHNGSLPHCADLYGTKFGLIGLLAWIRSTLTCFKIDSPEVGCRGQKLNPNSLSVIPGISNEHHAAFQFFLRDRIFEDNHLAIVQLVVEVQQPTMSVHHHGFTNLAKFLPVVASPVSFQPHLVKDALASA